MACQQSIDTAVPLCQKLGLPVEPDKVHGPTTHIFFLGIKLDSIAMEMRLPAVKLQRLRAALMEWEGRHSATKRQLQSIPIRRSKSRKVRQIVLEGTHPYNDYSQGGVSHGLP